MPAISALQLTRDAVTVNKYEPYNALLGESDSDETSQLSQDFHTISLSPNDSPLIHDNNHISPMQTISKKKEQNINQLSEEVCRDLFDLKSAHVYN